MPDVNCLMIKPQAMPYGKKGDVEQSTCGEG